MTPSEMLFLPFYRWRDKSYTVPRCERGSSCTPISMCRRFSRKGFPVQASAEAGSSSLEAFCFTSSISFFVFLTVGCKACWQNSNDLNQVIRQLLLFALFGLVYNFDFHVIDGAQILNKFKAEPDKPVFVKDYDFGNLLIINFLNERAQAFFL